MKTFDYTDLNSLQELSQYLVNQCKKTNCNTILLKGELGAGKTTITQNIAIQLGVKTRVNSPTFTIAKKYTTTDNYFLNLCHYDLYRLSGKQELDELGILEEINNVKNVVVIEWPELIVKQIEIENRENNK